MIDKHEVVIRFGDQLMNLYHLGYVSEDLAKVLVLAHSAREIRLGAVENFGSAVFRDPYDVGRNDPRFQGFLELLRIEKVRSGSIEIVLASASLLSSIVVPLVILRAQQTAGRGELTLDVRSNHPLINPLLQRYSAGDFGRGPEAMNRLFSDLARAGVDVSPISNDVFVIDSIVQRYSRRIASVIKMKRQ